MVWSCGCALDPGLTSAQDALKTSGTVNAFARAWKSAIMPVPMMEKPISSEEEDMIPVFSGPEGGGKTTKRFTVTQLA